MVVSLFTLYPRLGQIEQFVSHAQGALAAIRDARGNLAAELYRDPHDPHCYTLFEAWDAAAQRSAFWGSAAGMEIKKGLVGSLSGAPSCRKLYSADETSSGACEAAMKVLGTT